MDIRNIEKAWRVAWMRMIGRMLPGARTASLPTDRPLRVLFVRYERIGDMIMATGMIRALAESPMVESLDVVANPSTRPVLEHNPHIRNIFTLDRKSWGSYRTLGAELRRERYDVIVDGRINNPPVFTSTPLLMLRAGAPYRVGVGGGNNDLVYNVRVAPYDRSVHYVEGSKALAVPFGIDVNAESWNPEIFLTRDEERRSNEVWKRAAARVAAPGNLAVGVHAEPRLLVNLSASEPKRRWDDANFIEVLRAVREGHPRMPIVVMGLPAEWSSVERVAREVNAEAAATPKLREALALVGTSERVFTPDTSISHAASAFGKRAVVLLKREHHPYAPWGNPAEIVFWDGETIEGLRVEPVREAVMRMVAE
jgi:ADP-heptose:LPS heptosyltransferase